MVIFLIPSLTLRFLTTQAFQKDLEALEVWKKTVGGPNKHLTFLVPTDLHYAVKRSYGGRNKYCKNT